MLNLALCLYLRDSKILDLVSLVFYFIVLVVYQMGQTHLNKVFSHLLSIDELRQLLMQCDNTLGIEDLLSIVLHDFKARLKDVFPVNLMHVGIERLLIANLLCHLSVLHGKVHL